MTQIDIGRRDSERQIYEGETQKDTDRYWRESSVATVMKIVLEEQE